MSVYDRWHLSHPPDGAQPCRCGRGRNKLYPTDDHQQGLRWQVRYRDDEGKQRKRSFHERYGDNPELHADAFDAQNSAQLNSDTWINPAAGKVTLSDYARQWLAAQTCDRATLRSYGGRLGRVHDAPIGGQPMTLLAKRPSMVQQWVKGLEDRGLEASTIGHTVGILSMVFNAAVQDGVVVRNPVHAKSVVKPPRVVRKKIVPWTLGQLAAAQASLDDQYQAMVDVGAGCGLRQGEIFAVTKQSVDFLRRELHVRMQVRIVDKRLVFSLPKGDKERTVPLPEQTGLVLAAHVAEHPPVAVTLPWDGPGKAKTMTAELLFTRPGALALHQGLFNDQQWRPARRAAGVAETRENGMHILRHTAASIWLAGGNDVVKVAAWLGHSTPATTWRYYAHFIPDQEDLGRKAMDAFWSGEGVSASDVPVAGAP